MVDRVHVVVGSPLGPLTLVASGGVLSGLYMEGARYRPPSGWFGVVDEGPFGVVRGLLERYFVGEAVVFDVPVVLMGTAFQVRVWEELRRVGWGSTVTYGGLASRLGVGSGWVRAVASANARNPLSIVVPCHRVVGSDGSLRGYAGGLERKRWLLDHEAGSRLVP